MSSTYTTVHQRHGESVKHEEGLLTVDRLPSSRPRRKNAYESCHRDLWAIHGQYYDLTSFLAKHPGGQEMLLLGKGRDCTELFESVHALSRLNMRKLLDKYRVDTPKEGPPPPSEFFSWQEDGFYAVLSKRVKQHYTTQASYKATPAYWAKVAILCLLWVLLITATYSTGYMALAFGAGLVMNMLGFNVMHDGSHYGISDKPWVNRVCHTLWSDWNLWSHWLWLQHHVYGHHSYTGVFRRDPDLVNASIFLRKTDDLRPGFLHKLQHWVAYPLLLAAPNQHVGQLILYVRAWVVKNVFGVKFSSRMPKIDLIASWALYIPSLVFHFFLPFYYLEFASVAMWVIVAYWSGLGVGYAINIIPNHDTFETHLNVGSADPSGQSAKRDWGVQQVLGSGNHSTDGGLWSTICATVWGGMNYQIEHHLFPSVSHVHFPVISKIVQQTASEFSIPYVTHSWGHSFVSFFRLLAHLAVAPKKIE